MDSSCIDAYLMNYWFDNVYRAQVIYLPTKYLTSLHGNGLEPDEIQSLSNFIGTFDKVSQLWDRPYALVIHHKDHFLSLHLTTGASASMSIVWMDYDPHNDEETWIKGDVWGGFTIYKNLKFTLSNEGPEDQVICNSVNWIQVTIKFLFFVQLLTIILIPFRMVLTEVHGPLALCACCLWKAAVINKMQGNLLQALLMLWNMHMPFEKRFWNPWSLISQKPAGCFNSFPSCMMNMLERKYTVS